MTFRAVLLTAAVVAVPAGFLLLHRPGASFAAFATASLLAFASVHAGGFSGKVKKAGNK